MNLVLVVVCLAFIYFIVSELIKLCFVLLVRDVFRSVPIQEWVTIAELSKQTGHTEGLVGMSLYMLHKQSYVEARDAGICCEACLQPVLEFRRTHKRPKKKKKWDWKNLLPVLPGAAVPA